MAHALSINHSYIQTRHFHSHSLTIGYGISICILLLLYRYVLLVGAVSITDLESLRCPLVGLCSHWQSDPVARPIPQSTEPMVPYSLFPHLNNPLLDHRQDVTSMAAWSYPPNVINRLSMQFHSRPEAQSHRGLIAIDPFRVDPMALSAAGLLALPPNFPPHADSIRAEIFSQKNSSHHSDPIPMLHFFRQKTISAHGGNMEQAPTTFSYAKAINFPHLIPTQFGVSAPRVQSHAARLAYLVRDYRLRQCWGDQQPPVQQEQWKHGHCAENQSLPSVVARCREFGLENVLIETLAMHRSGNFISMCKNCLSYVFCVLREHPTWRVCDVYTGNIFLMKPSLSASQVCYRS